MNKLAQLSEFGATFIDALVPPAALRSYKAERARVIGDIEQRWCDGILNGIEAPTYFDYTDLSDFPSVVSILPGLGKEILGPRLGASHRLHETRLRFVAPYPLGYLNWHVDHFDGPEVLYKAVVYLSDVPLNAGELCYVPGSHRWLDVGDIEKSALNHGFRRFPGRAGSCVLFDSAGVHSPSANNHVSTRESLMLKLARW